MKKMRTDTIDLSSLLKTKTNSNARYGFRNSIQWKNNSAVWSQLPLYLDNVSSTTNLSGWYYEHENPAASVLEVVLVGTLEITHNDRTTRVTPGNAYFLPGGESSRLANPGSEMLKKITFSFSGEYAYFIWHSTLGENCLIPIEDINRIQNYHHTFKRLLESGNEEKIPQICGLAMEFIMYVTQVVRKAEMPNVLNSILKILHANLARRIKITDLASSVHLSPYQMHRIFRAHFGQSPSEYQFQLRMKKAKSLLANNNLFALKNIAMQLGYANPFVFSAAFKRYYGISPKQFRRGLEFRG